MFATATPRQSADSGKRIAALAKTAVFSMDLKSSKSARPRFPVCGEPLMSTTLRAPMFPRRQWYQIPCTTHTS